MEGDRDGIGKADELENCLKEIGDLLTLQSLESVIRENQRLLEEVRLQKARFNQLQTLLGEEDPGWCRQALKDVSSRWDQFFKKKTVHTQTPYRVHEDFKVFQEILRLKQEVKWVKDVFMEQKLRMRKLCRTILELKRSRDNLKRKMEAEEKRYQRTTEEILKRFEEVRVQFELTREESHTDVLAFKGLNEQIVNKNARLSWSNAALQEKLTELSSQLKALKKTNAKLTAKLERRRANHRRRRKREEERMKELEATESSEDYHQEEVEEPNQAMRSRTEQLECHWTGLTGEDTPHPPS